MAVACDKAKSEREPAMDTPVGRDAPGLANIFTGAPLDAVKLVAASLMVVDHVNAMFLQGPEVNIWWKLGRIVFPLFCFAVACNLRRGTRVPEYVAMLLLLGVVSQPIYAKALTADDGNILFTLAVGATILTALRTRSVWLQHAVLGLGVAAIFTPWIRARSGLDFGLAGMLFPAAIYLVMDGRWSHLPWLVLLLVGLNWHQPHPMQFAPLSAALFAGVGSLAVVLLALAFRHRPRFLPRYALHVFYPGHLLVLLVISELIT
jgi:TraX protein